VKAVLARSFGGNPVNAQNLSNWRQGGFQQWRKRRERAQFMEDWMMDADDLAQDNRGLGARLTAVLLAELAMAVQAVLPTLTEPGERCAKIMEYLRVLSRVQQQEQAEQRLEWEAADREREHAERLERQLETLEMRLAMGKVLQADQAQRQAESTAAETKRAVPSVPAAAGDGKGKSSQAEGDSGGRAAGGGRSQPIKVTSVTLDSGAAQPAHMRRPDEGEVGKGRDDATTESLVEGGSSRIKVEPVQ
jgi:hypothetical protein